MSNDDRIIPDYENWEELNDPLWEEEEESEAHD